MRRTHFLIVSLALLASAPGGAESPAVPSPAVAAQPVTSTEAIDATATTAAKATEPTQGVTPPSDTATAAPTAVTPVETTVADATAAPEKVTRGSKTIVLGPQGVDDQGRVGRLHTVARGDTLWDLSDAYLGTPWVWPSVWVDNHDIKNPHWIHPGDRIWITANEMRVVSDHEADEFLQRLIDQPPSTDGAADTAASEAPAPPAAAAPAATEASEPVLASVAPPSNTGRQITVSLRAAMGFVSTEQLEGASSIVGSPSERTFMTAGDVVYLGLGEGDAKVGDRYTIFEVVEQVPDIGSNRVLGHHVDILGWLEVKQLTGDTSIGEIRMSYSEIPRGARILARPPVSRHVTVLQTPAATEGQIVFLPGRKTVMGDGDYVYLNRGELDGLEVGSELEVTDRGRIENDVPRDVDVQTPDHKAATLVVVTVEPQTAVAFVLNAGRELEVGDTVRPMAASLASR
jgi:hypothetical protein